MVVILNSLCQANLVFHRIPEPHFPWSDRPIDIRHAPSFTSGPIQVFVATSCGEPIFYGTYNEETESHNHDVRPRGERLRVGHAIKIARPCRKCFPRGVHVWSKTSL